MNVVITMQDILNLIIAIVWLMMLTDKIKENKKK